MILFRRKNLQVYGWTPRAKRDGRYATTSRVSYGMAVRVRRFPTSPYRPVWTHVRLTLNERLLKPRGRGTRTFEVSSWNTSPGVLRDRVTLKRFVRVKLGLGGPRYPALVEEDEDVLYDDDEEAA